jgi:prepilin signal peptidase PulO-like enzyme (type II secretory pathway)
MNEPSPNTGSGRAIIIALIAVGLLCIAVATGVVSLPGGPPEAPRWVLGGIGLIFLIAGLLGGQWWPSKSLLSDMLAAMMMTIIGVTFGWIAIFGHGFQNRFGSIRTSVGDAFPRAMFGLGALACLALAVYGWWRTIANRR